MSDVHTQSVQQMPRVHGGVNDRVDRAIENMLSACAVGRIVWGIAALAAPGWNIKVAGMSHKQSPELRYMIRVFGARALALGLGYSLSTDSQRSLWQRLGVMVDISDTCFGLAHLVRGDVPRASAAGLTTITGSYALIGTLKVLRDVNIHVEDVE